MSGGILAGEGDVFVGGVKGFCQVHFQTFGSGDDDFAATVLAKHLGEDEASRAGAEHENGRAHFWGDLVEAVGGAGGRLEESGVDVGEVFDLEDTLGGVGAKFGEAAVHCYAVGLEVFAEEFFAAAAVEAFTAEFGVVSDDALADAKAFDLGADGCDDTDSLMTYRSLGIRHRSLQGGRRRNVIPGINGNWSFGVSGWYSCSLRVVETCLGQEFTLVNVQICSADTAGLDFDLRRC